MQEGTASLLLQSGPISYRFLTFDRPKHYCKWGSPNSHMMTSHRGTGSFLRNWNFVVTLSLEAC